MYDHYKHKHYYTGVLKLTHFCFLKYNVILLTHLTRTTVFAREWCVAVVRIRVKSAAEF